MARIERAGLPVGTDTGTRGGSGGGSCDMEPELGPGRMTTLYGAPGGRAPHWHLSAAVEGRGEGEAPVAVYRDRLEP